MSRWFARLRTAWLANRWVRTGALILSVFGPATIAAMADNDASGVATYSIAGATLGYPILFLLTIITVLLAMTQEMGMRLTLVTRRGLADLIFEGLLVANIGTIVVDLAAVSTSSQLLGIPAIPMLLGVLLLTFAFITWG